MSDKLSEIHTEQTMALFADVAGYTHIAQELQAMAKRYDALSAVDDPSIGQLLPLLKRQEDAARATANAWQSIRMAIARAHVRSLKGNTE